MFKNTGARHLCLLFGLSLFFTKIFMYGYISYTYPIAYVPVYQKWLVSCQENDQTFLVWWDEKSEQCDPALSTIHRPLFISLLPNQQGFSFIDNGILKVKEYLKRSAATILVDQPIKNMQQIQWIDEHSCYLHALFHKKYVIVQINRTGISTIIRSHPHHDCLYPCKINKTLFYVLHNPIEGKQDQVMKGIYDMTNDGQQDEVIMLSDGQIVALYMYNIKKGYVIILDSDASSSDTFTFKTFHLHIQHHQWFLDYLFSFDVPVHYICGDQRHYESLMPFLPFFDNDTIYFNSGQYILNSFVYDINSKRIMPFIDSAHIKINMDKQTKMSNHSLYLFHFAKKDTQIVTGFLKEL